MARKKVSDMSPEEREKYNTYMKEYRAKKKAEGKAVKRGSKTNNKKETNPLKMPWNLTKYKRKEKGTPNFLTWDIETVADKKQREEIFKRTNQNAAKHVKKGQKPTLLEWADENHMSVKVAGDPDATPFKLSWDLAGETVIVSACFGRNEDGSYDAKLYDGDDLTLVFEREFLTPEHNEWFIYAHNGFGFDLKRLDFGRLMNKGYTAEIVNGNSNDIKSITLKKEQYTWYLRDTLLLLNNKLGKLAEAFAEDNKKKLQFEYESFDGKNEAHREYALYDSIVLYQIVENADKLFMDKMGVSLHDKSTLPGLAFQAMKQMFLSDEYFEGVSFKLAHACRESYHGGQTLALNTEPHENEKSLDANSMYVYIMKTFALPTGKVNHYWYLPDDSALEKTLCLAKVTIPEGVFPFLKTKDASGKVGNYRGEVVGWYWLFELEFQKEIGGRYEVFESYEWESDTDAVKRFALRCEALRMSDYNGPIGMIGKLFGNAGYGKFAQVTPDAQLVLSAEPPEGALRRFDPEADMNDDTFVWQVPTKKGRPTPDMVHWASYITAHARMHLSKIMEVVGFENVDYCDTDSIFIEERFMDRVPPEMLGGKYGQFKLEKDMTHFQAFGKKAYQYISVKDGSRTVANKGIPRDALKSQLIQPGKEHNGQALYFISTPSLAATWLNGTPATIAHRTLVTPGSLTDGKFINHKWVPGTCEPMSYFDLVVPLKERPIPKYPPRERIINKFNKFMGGTQDGSIHTAIPESHRTIKLSNGRILYEM